MINEDRIWTVMKYLGGGLLLAMLLILALPVAMAQGECNGHSCNDGGGTVMDNTQHVNISPGDTIYKGGRALALGSSLGDVDIAQCLASAQWNTALGGKQRLVLNQICMAEFYLKRGRFDLAAQALCNQDEILAEYATERECEDDHDFTPPDIDDDSASELSRVNEAYELAQRQDEEIEYLQEEQASLVGRVDALTAYIEQPPAPAAVQQQAPQYTDEHVNAVWAALKGSEDDDDE